MKKLEFFYISGDKTDSIVGIVSQNLATSSNFVKFRDGRDFTSFEAPGVGCHMAACEEYT